MTSLSILNLIPLNLGIIVTGLSTASLFILAGYIFKKKSPEDRLNIPLIAVLALSTLVVVISWTYQITGYKTLLSAILWAGIVCYGAGTLLWVAFRIISKIYYSEPPTVYGPEDIQVRIMTIDAEDVVQETVNALPDSITDRHVIAESPIEVDGAEVHVVPEAFSCKASRKGRALEWARRSLKCEREFILYLDEDTIVSEFEGLPDEDIVQFGEQPYRTGGLIPYLSEIFRVGFQLEQRTFGLLPVPLYAWGGGIAIRTSVEKRVTWNYDTLIEDTVFVWRAVTEYDASFVPLRTCFNNQAPASIDAMVSQRRRWIGGSESELWRLPWYYRPIFRFRNLIWGLTPLAVIVPMLTLIFPESIYFEQQYLQLSFVMLLVPLFWSILGFDYLSERQLIGVLLIPFTPIITFVHSAGAFVGLLTIPNQFATTAKAGGQTTPDVEITSRRQSPIQGIQTGIHSIAGAAVAAIGNWRNEALSSAPGLFIQRQSDAKTLAFERPHIKFQPAAILSTIVTVGALIRFYGLGEASYWVDEIYSVTVRGSMPLEQLFTAAEPHPPLYYLLLKFWMEIFGQGEFAVRTLSALFGVGSILGIYFLCKKLFDRSGGYIGATLMALSTFNLHVSQTARMYAPLTFFTVVTSYYLIRVLNDGGYLNSTLYGLSVVGLLFTHLFGGFVVLAQNIYALGVLLVDSQERWNILRRWLVIKLPISALYLAYLATVLLPQLTAKVEGESKAGWIFLPTFDYMIKGLLAVGGAPFQYPLSDYSPFTIYLSWFFIIVASVSLIWGTVRFESEWSFRDWTLPNINLSVTGARGKFIGGLIFLCCFLLPYILSYLITPMFIVRYLAPASVGAIILIAGGVATIRSDAVRVIVMLGLVVSSGGLVGIYHQTSTDEDWRAAANYIDSGESTDPLVIIKPGWVSKSLTFYNLPSEAKLVGNNNGYYGFGADSADNLSASVRSNDTVYVVRREPANTSTLNESIGQTHRMVGERDYGEVTVFKFKRREGSHLN